MHGKAVMLLSTDVVAAKSWWTQKGIGNFFHEFAHQRLSVIMIKQLVPEVAEQKIIDVWENITGSVAAWLGSSYTIPKHPSFWFLPEAFSLNPRIVQPWQRGADYTCGHHSLPLTYPVHSWTQAWHSPFTQWASWCVRFTGHWHRWTK